MDRVKADYCVVVENSQVKKVGSSCVGLPEIKWNGKGIKWFDDSKLIKNK